MRPRELKKQEDETRCTILDKESAAFVVLLGFIVDLVPLALELRAPKYVRIRLRQPEPEQTLHRLLATGFRVLKLHLPHLTLQVEHKENVHACYRVWSTQIPIRADVKTINASGTRSAASGNMRLWA